MVRNEIRNFGFVRVADDKRNTGESSEFFGGALGITAGDEDFGRGILRVYFPDGVSGLSVGCSGDGASVDDDKFRAVWRRNRGATAVEQLALDSGAVGLGGAAAELFEVKGGHRTKQGI